jgi:hypothetical protein
VLTVAASEADRYTGKWRVSFEPAPGGAKALPPALLTIRRAENGMLFASLPPGVASPPPPRAPDPAALAKLTPLEREREEAKQYRASIDGGAFEYLLVPRADGVFLMGWQEDGVLLDIEEMYHEFELEGGRAVRLTLRNKDDQVRGRGVRENH